MTHTMEQMTIPGLEETAIGNAGRGRWPMMRYNQGMQQDESFVYKKGIDDELA